MEYGVTINEIHIKDILLELWISTRSDIAPVTLHFRPQDEYFEEYGCNTGHKRTVSSSD